MAATAIQRPSSAWYWLTSALRGAVRGRPLVDAELADSRRAHVGDEDIGRADQLEEHRTVVAGAQVEGDRPLVPVAGGIGDARAHRGAGRGTSGRRRVRAGRIAVLALHLDH